MWNLWRRPKCHSTRQYEYLLVSEQLSTDSAMFLVCLREAIGLARRQRREFFCTHNRISGSQRARIHLSSPRMMLSIDPDLHQLMPASRSGRCKTDTDDASSPDGIVDRDGAEALAPKRPTTAPTCPLQLYPVKLASLARVFSPSSTLPRLATRPR